jgi:transposase
MLIRERGVVDTVQADATTRAMQMRGSDGMQEGLFTLAKLDAFVPADHPLRAIRVLVNEALVGLNELFNSIYADSGRASIAPEKLLRAMLIQVFFSVRSERQLMEQVRYNLLFRWFAKSARPLAAGQLEVVAERRLPCAS